MPLVVGNINTVANYFVVMNNYVVFNIYMINIKRDRIVSMNHRIPIISIK